MVCRFFVPLRDQRADQVLRHAAQAEAANHDGRAVKHVADGLIRIGHNFVHSVRILNEFAHPVALSGRQPVTII